VVFPTAPDAVAAATQAQRELASYPWPGGERVRVRMGIHAGSPTVRDGAYVGMDVHRAARIAGAAHDGQVFAQRRQRWRGNLNPPSLQVRMTWDRISSKTFHRWRRMIMESIRRSMVARTTIPTVLGVVVFAA
jgi:class 3 adenylate cyclase